MKLTFLGTRGNIKHATHHHQRHSALLITHHNMRIMIDCGLDWRKKIFYIHPSAIFITHAHPDHAFGLTNGSPCPVYATRASWKIMKQFAIEPHLRQSITHRTPVTIGSITLEAFPVIHSLHAPAVGYRISDGHVDIFYVPDLIKIKQQRAALKDIRAYIGDGATIAGGHLVRYANSTPFGHSSIKVQLDWCKKEHVPTMVVTHCGSEIVTSNERISKVKISALGQERGVEVLLAHDNMELQLH